MLTLQQIYDKSLAHVRNQGRAASDGVGGCFYRTPGGLACGVGGLFPDSAYDPRLDKDGGSIGYIMGISDDDEWFGPVKSILQQALLAGDIDLYAPRVVQVLEAVQRAHDDASVKTNHYEKTNYMYLYEENMRGAAQTLGLVYKEPT